ncbi:hypothetical protein AD952_05630 [Acetobacter cerevisiae]|uniref:Transglycosylase SLT domain-containing protein n=1 Tax=Acetobacter cerevisiae TaxID=178900 RepID=A0A149UWE4_9PROT|nr:hypothetical protein [Acetobacter cerevisiae]KXV72194.1 hypothetical protein AD952_05630 [Acetobacter cerevisiae]
MADFIWGANGEEVTPEEIAQRKQMAQSLLAQSQQRPANYWTQGLANMADALMGGFMQGRAMRAERANDDFNKDALASLLQQGSGSGGAPSAPTSSSDSPPIGDPAQPISPVAAALTNPQTGEASPAAQNGASDLIAQGLLDHMRQAESGGDNTAKNPRSSATGAFQFTNPTWTGLMRQHPELGLTADGRTDPAQSETAAKQLASDNIAYMLAKGVQNPTQGQAYLAHFAGAPAATNLIQADPSAPASSILSPAQVAANPFLRGMTAGQVQDWAAQKMGSSVPQAQQTPAPQPSPGYGMPAPAQSGPSMSALIGVLSDPRANQQTRGVASALLNNQLQLQQVQQRYAMEQADPENQARMRYYDSMVSRNNGQPQMTPEQQNLQWRAQQAGLQPGTQGYQQFILNGGKMPGQADTGVQTLTAQQATANGLDPSKTWAVGRDGVPKAVGDSPQAVQQHQQSVQQAGSQAVDALTTAANSALSLLDQHPSSTTGTLGHYTAEWLPGSNAAQLRNQIETIKASGSYATMQQLKGQGISMGQMSDADMKMAAAKAGAINPDAPPAVVKQQIRDYADFVKRAYAGSGPSAQTATRETSGGAQTTTTGVKWSVR